MLHLTMSFSFFQESSHASVKTAVSVPILASPLSATAQHSTLEHSVNNVNMIISYISSSFNY